MERPAGACIKRIIISAMVCQYAWSDMLKFIMSKAESLRLVFLVDSLVVPPTKLEQTLVLYLPRSWSLGI
jgi:hypothetical protein